MQRRCLSKKILFCENMFFLLQLKALWLCRKRFETEQKNILFDNKQENKIYCDNNIYQCVFVHIDYLCINVFFLCNYNIFIVYKDFMALSKLKYYWFIKYWTKIKTADYKLFI